MLLALAKARATGRQSDSDMAPPSDIRWLIARFRCKELFNSVLTVR